MDDKKDLLLKFREFAELNLKNCVCERTGQPYIETIDFLVETLIDQVGFNVELGTFYLIEIVVKKPELLSEIRDKFGDEVASLVVEKTAMARELVFSEILQDYVTVEAVGFVNKDDFVPPKLQIFDVVQYETCQKCGKDVDKSLHFCKN
jgi:hypothetical protein